MKEVEIDGKRLIIYEDGSIRIPHKDMHLCLDFMDIAFLYNESMKALNERAPDRKDTARFAKKIRIQEIKSEGESNETDQAKNLASKVQTT